MCRANKMLAFLSMWFSAPDSALNTPGRHVGAIGKITLGLNAHPQLRPIWVELYLPSD